VTEQTNGVQPRPRRPAAPAGMLLYALALGLLFASIARSQVIENAILLPDSLGPLYGENHVAFDEDSVNPRIFIGGEGGDVIVANALTCKRVARIKSGPMNALCYVPAHNRVYVSTTDENGVVVVDGSSYEVIKRIPSASSVTGLCYNPVNDRVYCATDPLKIIDCTADSVVDSVPMNATDAKCAFDGARNKLYVSASDSLRVVDCSHDSVVTRIFGLRGAQAMCFQPSAEKMYVAAGESLFALQTESDTIVYRHRYDTLDAQLACDSVHNRVYYTYWSHIVAMDCKRDTTIWTKYLWARATGLTSIPACDKLHMMLSGLGQSYDYVLEGFSGQTLCRLDPTSFQMRVSLCFNPGANRVFLVTDQCEAACVDCDADSICGAIRLTVRPYNMCVDSVHNRLYFCSPSGSGSRGYFGIADCVSNKVTSYLTAFDDPSWMTYIPDDDRLYVCGYDSCIFVYDCAADSVLKVIRTGTDHRVFSLHWHRALNKLYAVVVNYPDDSARLAVIERAGDTIVKSLGFRAPSPGPSFIVPELNQFWTFQGGRYYVVDCLGDSVVIDAALPSGFRRACCCPADRRVYAFTWSAAYVIDMGTGLITDSMPAPTRWDYGMSFGAEQAHKVYWQFWDLYGRQDSVFALDTRTNQIVATFTVPCMTQFVFSGNSGRHVYYVYDTLAVVDSRTDSVINRVKLPCGFDFGVANDATRRLYLADGCDSILVVYDSLGVQGLCAGPAESMRAEGSQTLLDRGQPLRCVIESALYDPSGRRAAVLLPGANDISHLAPGVYFAREEPQAASSKPRAVRKVVIAK
jgi:DNA-binding beta-propeller fold protein YncE